MAARGALRAWGRKASAWHAHCTSVEPMGERSARTRVCVTSAWSQTRALRATTSAPTAIHPHSRVRTRAQLLVAAASHNCGTFGNSQIWNARIRVCVTFAWSQARALRAATSTPHARHPHSRMCSRPRTRVAAARHKCGTLGVPQIWDARIRVCVTFV